MPNIFGGGISQPGSVNLQMQVATVGPITPSAVISTYGAFVNLGSPRSGGGMIPLAIKAVSTGSANNDTLNIVPTWSDGSVGAGLVWTPFTVALLYMQSGILVANKGSIPEADPAASEEADMFIDTPVDLTLLFKQGLYLTNLGFRAKSSGALDAAVFTVTYWGLYS